MADAFYVSSFGGLRLWISKLSTDKSRTQVRHELSAGNDFVVQDKGRALVTTRAELLFDFMDGDSISPLDRLRQLSAMVDDQPRILSHPVEGSFSARVGPFNYEINESGVISASVEFVPVSPVEAIAPATGGNILGPGLGIASVAVDDLLAELADADLTSDTPAAVQSAVDGWDDDDISPRQILAETSSLTAELGDEAEAYDDDVNLWQAFKATVVLAETVRAAAEAATAGVSATFLLRVGTPIALRALLTSTYPADEADARYDEIMQLNDIASPWSLDLGTELLMPLPSPLPRGA